MADPKNEIPTEEKKSSTVEGYGEAGINFNGVSALGAKEIEKERWYVSLGNSALSGLIKLGLFLLGFLLDILKAIWSIVSGIFIYAYKSIIGLCKFIRKEFRMFREMDVWGKASFLVQGIGCAKYGQIVDGIIFFAVEVLFVVYMVVTGGNAIALLGQLGVKRVSHTRLINGIIAIIVCVAYVVVYIKGIFATYDDYQILHELEYRAAREDALYVAKNMDQFPEINFKHASHHKVYRVMRKKYGYSWLSARFIGYAPLKNAFKKDSALVTAKTAFVQKIYNRYCAWRDKVEAGLWADAFASFLEWKFIKPKSPFGIENVINNLEIDLLKFRHTYDKYNDYHSVVRDSEATLKVYADSQELLKTCYAEDPVSVKNGIKPVAHGSKVKAKELVSRIVGNYEIAFETGIRISKVLAKILKSVKTDEETLKAFDTLREKEQLFHDNFIQVNRTNVIAEEKAVEEVYASYGDLLPRFGQGKKAAMSYLCNEKHISKRLAGYIVNDMALSARAGSTEAESSMDFANRGKRFLTLGVLMRDYAFHGKTLSFEKHAKQFTDEKFATTVLALPTIGALLTCVLPLFFSIAIAFTNWDGAHSSYNFNWDLSAWASVFGMGESGGSFIYTFGTLLRWTIVWAIFATFTNYIGGIILALLINKKGIKFKGLWRTMFVITIAIPQFITLLAVNLLFASDGAINEWMQANWGFKIPFLDTITNGVSAFQLDSNYTFIKFMIIVFNMWVGIPYTMLSTSGILMNIPGDLYESAQIDGASAWTQFWKITMPYILFVTGPSLLTSFIGNINNFNIIFFLTGGGPSELDALSQMNAGHTDLLITWLYKLTVSKNIPEYAMGSVIGILVFIVCAFFSLIMYKRMGSVKNEEAFQ